MSWAAIARKDAEVVAESIVNWADEKPRVAVVDANAIISGLTLHGIAERAVTIQDVIGEIRDKKSRDWMQSLPYQLDIVEPCDESIKAVTTFAKMTGDLRNLSKPDIHMIALAHDLEVKMYGDLHLRKEPKKARVAPKTRFSGKKLPGWGAEGDEWAELDAIEGLASSGGPASKIGAQLQDLAPAAAQSPTAVDGMEGNAGQHEDMHMSEVNEDDLASNQDDGGKSDDGWEVAAKSNTARRHKIQKAAKRAEREKLQEMIEQQELEQDCSLQGHEESNENNEIEMQDIDDDDTDDGPHASFESNVASVTADFAMQNVILQMGLRLVTPDGRRIKEVHTWVLRCSACLTTTREISRLFCPQCGNASLDKVELTIGPDGAEQFGVRKKHNLRGTRYSLPKPKGGKKTKDPVLREDVLLMKAPRRRPKPSKIEEDGGWVTEFGMASAVASASSQLTPGLQKGLAPLTNAWKNNPNERKHKGSNRRRK